MSKNNNKFIKSRSNAKFCWTGDICSFLSPIFTRDGKLIYIDQLFWAITETFKIIAHAELKILVPAKLTLAFRQHPQLFQEAIQLGSNHTFFRTRKIKLGQADHGLRFNRESLRKFESISSQGQTASFPSSFIQ